MWLANFANDASSMVHLRSSPWHIPCQPYGRLSIVVNYPSVSIRAAQSGLQSAPACRMQWVCHHLFRSYDRNLSNIANIRLHSVSGHTWRCKDNKKFSNFLHRDNDSLSEHTKTYQFHADVALRRLLREPLPSKLQEGVRLGGLQRVVIQILTNYWYF